MYIPFVLFSHLKLLDLFLKLSTQGLLILNFAQKLAGLKVLPVNN